MNKKWFLFLVVALVTIVSLLFVGCAPEAAPPEEKEELPTYHFKFAQPIFPEGSLEHDDSMYIINTTTEKSNGRITWDYYGPELCGYSELEGMLMEGIMEFAMTSPTPLHDRRWNMIECPYMFETLEQVKELTGPDGLLTNMGREWAPDINQYLLGLHPQEWTGVSLTPRIVTTPEEAKGLKLRTPPSEARVCCWRTLGFTCTTMDYSEVPSALATGVIDGQAGGGYYQAYDCCRDFQKYLVIYRDTFVPFVIVANLGVWNSIAPEDQKIIQDAVNVVVRRGPDRAVERDKEYKKILEDEYGWTCVDLLEEYPEKFQAAVDLVRATCWPVLDELVGKSYMDQLREYHGMK